MNKEPKSIQEKFNEILNTYLQLGESPESINDGLCADFSNSLNDIVKSSSKIFSIYDYEDLISAIENYNFNVPFDISPLEKMDKRYFPFGHTFLVFKGKFYDSESIEGVSRIEDLKIIKRNFKEYLESPFYNVINLNEINESMSDFEIFYHIKLRLEDKDGWDSSNKINDFGKSIVYNKQEVFLFAKNIEKNRFFEICNSFY